VSDDSRLAGESRQSMPMKLEGRLLKPAEMSVCLWPVVTQLSCPG
jgi:hypothetical protein